jgi:hypothetical protein
MTNTPSSMDKASDRITLGKEAGNEYVENLESIRHELTSETTGTTLGAMVGAQLKMTEVETEYMVKSGLPKKASATHQAAAQDVKKAAGG